MWEFFEIQAGGWVEYRDTDLEPAVRVRFADRGGRLQMEELYLVGGAISSDTMRQLPIGRLEAAANSPGVATRLRERIEEGLDRVEQAAERFVRDTSPSDAAEGRRPIHKPRIRLTVPTDRKRPDDFYRSVAEAFAWLAHESNQPARDLAEANAVPVTTVHRWVKEARRRGLLAPARRQELPDDERIEDTAVAKGDLVQAVKESAPEVRPPRRSASPRRSR